MKIKLILLTLSFATVTYSQDPLVIKKSKLPDTIPQVALIPWDEWNTQEKSKRSENSKNLQNHPFGSISKNYTLLLTGYFDDCGEFGGHKETIELMRIDRKFSARVTIYDKICQESTNAKPIIIKSKIYLVDENKVTLFKAYMNKLLTKSLKYYEPFHAGRTYSAKLDFRKPYEDNDKETKDNFSFQRINIIYHDNASNWTEFQKLKNILVK